MIARIPANENIKHEGFEDCLDLCDALNADRKFISLVTRNVSKRNFDNFFWFIKFEIEFRYSEVLNRRQAIGVVQ